MRFLLVWFLRLLLALLTVIFQLLLLPIILTALRLLRDLVFLSFSATVNGPRGFIDRLAGEWTERIQEGSNNRGHINEIFQLCRFIAGTLVVLGWLFTTIFTAAILRVVFGFFI